MAVSACIILTSLCICMASLRRDCCPVLSEQLNRSAERDHLCALVINFSMANVPSILLVCVLDGCMLYMWVLVAEQLVATIDVRFIVGANFITFSIGISYMRIQVNATQRLLKKFRRSRGAGELQAKRKLDIVA